MNWDKYFHGICKEVSKNSKCLSRQIGAILVNDKSIISTGYNGPPRGIMPCSERYKKDPILKKAILDIDFKVVHPNDDDGKPIKEEFLVEPKIDYSICPRVSLGFKSGQGLDWCVAGHAERNTLINAARQGVSTKDSIMYMDCGIPCGDCLIEIINSGVKELVCTKLIYYDFKSKFLHNNSDIKIRVFEHLIDKENDKY